MALVLTQGAFAGAEPYLDGNQPAITRSLPNWAVTSGELLVVGLGSCSANAAQGDPYFDLTGGGLTWTRRAEARRTDGGQFKASDGDLHGHRHVDDDDHRHGRLDDDEC